MLMTKERRLSLRQQLQSVFNGDNNETQDEQFDGSLLIIDSVNYFIRAFTANPLVNHKGQHIGGVLSFIYSVLWAIGATAPSRCILVFDGSGGSKRRKELYPDYKGQRKQSTKLNRKYNDGYADDPEESFGWQMNILSEFIETLPVTTIITDNIEADDVIAYICKKYNECKITIGSTDKDFIQLVDDRVKIFHPIKKIFYDRKYIQSNFNLLPENYIYAKCLCGDVGDNIKGIDGIGLPTAVKRFPMLSERIVLNISEIIEHAKILSEAKKPPLIYKRVVENEDLLNLNFKLMQLEDVDISGKKKLSIGDMMNAPINKFDELQLRKLWKRYGLSIEGRFINSSDITKLRRLDAAGSK